jgi:hypothetical protein
MEPDQGMNLNRRSIAGLEPEMLVTRQLLTYLLTSYMQQILL